MIWEAGAALRALLEPDVEPDGRIERRHLVQKDVGQLRLEGGRVGVAREVAALAPPGRDRAGDAADHLLDRVLPRIRPELSAEILLRDDVGRVLRPRLRELDVALLERDLVTVTDPGVALLPLHSIERMLLRGGEMTADRETLAGPFARADVGLRYLRHSVLLLSFPLVRMPHLDSCPAEG